MQKSWDYQLNFLLPFERKWERKMHLLLTTLFWFYTSFLRVLRSAQNHYCIGDIIIVLKLTLFSGGGWWVSVVWWIKRHVLWCLKPYTSKGREFDSRLGLPLLLLGALPISTYSTKKQLMDCMQHAACSFQSILHRRHSILNGSAQNQYCIGESNIEWVRINIA